MRYMRVQVSVWLIVDILTKGHEMHVKNVTGLPEGSKFVHLIQTEHYGWIDFVFEHESFEELKIGDLIPLFPPPELEKLG